MYKIGNKIKNKSRKKLMKKVEIFTDGACSSNPGPGGWCAILKCNGSEKVLSGSEKETTNNRMELTAVIKALEALKFSCDVTVTTDSKYVCDAVNQRWVYSWRDNNWRKKDKKPALNPDLWQKLLALLEKHNVTFCWVKGHNDHPENERCDKIAVSEYQKYL